MTLFLLGDLSEREEAEFSRHLAGCDMCRESARELAPVLQSLADGLAKDHGAAPRFDLHHQLTLLSVPAEKPANRVIDWMARSRPWLVAAASGLVLTGLIYAVVFSSMSSQYGWTGHRAEGRAVAGAAPSLNDEASRSESSLMCVQPEPATAGPTAAGTAGSAPQAGSDTHAGWWREDTYYHEDPRDGASARGFHWKAKNSADEASPMTFGLAEDTRKLTEGEEEKKAAAEDGLRASGYAVNGTLGGVLPVSGEKRAGDIPGLGDIPVYGEGWDALVDTGVSIDRELGKDYAKLPTGKAGAAARSRPAFKKEYAGRTEAGRQKALQDYASKAADASYLASAGKPYPSSAATPTPVHRAAPNNAETRMARVRGVARDISDVSGQSPELQPMLNQLESTVLADNRAGVQPSKPMEMLDRVAGLERADKIDATSARRRDGEEPARMADTDGDGGHDRWAMEGTKQVVGAADYKGKPSDPGAYLGLGIDHGTVPPAAPQPDGRTIAAVESVSVGGLAYAPAPPPPPASTPAPDPEQAPKEEAPTCKTLFYNSYYPGKDSGGVSAATNAVAVAGVRPIAGEPAAPRPPRPKATALNPFVTTAENRFSTFSIDVNTASYNLTRQAIRSGALPDPDVVRTEEILNAFDYGDTAPDRATFRVYVEGAPSAFGAPGLTLLRIGVKGKRLGREEQRPAMLTFLIDTSGSMAEPDRIGRARTALRLLLDQLAPADRIQIVSFDDKARLVLPPTPAAQKDTILKAFDRLQCNGSTNLEDGMRRAYQQAARAFVAGGENRVILISDGVANLGADNAQDILKQVEEFRKQGVTCSVFGVGEGSYNDAMLEDLANKGQGVYRFLDTDDEVKRVFVDEFAATLNNIATDVKIQVEWSAEAVRRFRQLGYERRALTAEQFRDDTVDAGEVGSGQAVTALYELDLAPAAKQSSLGTVRVRYRRVDTGVVEEIAQAITADLLAPALSDARPQLRLAVGAAAFAELLRGSPYVTREYADVAKLLRGVAQELSLDPRVKELLSEVDAAEAMSK